MAPRLQPPPERGEVVDLTVEGDPDRPVLVAHGLTAARQVQDGEAALAERERPLGVIALVVGGALGERGPGGRAGHGFAARARGRRCARADPRVPRCRTWLPRAHPGRPGSDPRRTA